MNTRRKYLLALLTGIFCFGARSENPAPSVEEGTVYVSIGKRDPFKRPLSGSEAGGELSAVNPLEKFGIEQFQLRAILRGASTTKAMFEDPEGRVHIVSEGTIIGRERGTISRILNREVIVTERTVNYLGVTSLFERLLSLPMDTDLEQGAPPRESLANQSKASGAAGLVTSPSGLNDVIRNVTQERALVASPPPESASEPPVADAPSNFTNIQNMEGGTPPPPPPPPAAIQGGSDKGLVY